MFNFLQKQMAPLGLPEDDLEQVKVVGSVHTLGRDHGVWPHGVDKLVTHDRKHGVGRDVLYTDNTKEKSQIVHG